jgi:hypothetical protein
MAVVRGEAEAGKGRGWPLSVPSRASLGWCTVRLEKLTEQKNLTSNLTVNPCGYWASWFVSVLHV